MRPILVAEVRRLHALPLRDPYRRDFLSYKDLGEIEKLRAILTELVDLKGIHDGVEAMAVEDPRKASQVLLDYQLRKPRAWAAAREALGREG